MLDWLSRDGKLLLLSRATRAFAYGFLSVVLGIYLKLSGFDEVRIGLVMTATLISGAIFTLGASLYADRFGRRKVLILFAILMALAGIVFALTKDYLFLLLAALIGTINVTGTEVGPFLSIEQAMIPQTCAERRRTSAFALYSFVGTFATAAGALISGVPELLQGLGMGLEASFRPLFLAYALLGVATVGLFLMLSPATEMKGGGRGQPLGPGARRIVTRLSLLFGLDSFAGGFVIQSIVAYWFFTRFGVPLRDLALLFFWANILTALSFFAAARLAGRVGLVNTMVFTHLPSNVLLMLVPLAPSFPLAMALYLGRMAISQMDVPTRQSYIVAIVAPEERTAAAGMTNIARNVAQAVGPSVAGYALTLSLAAPFLVGGGLKVIYDLALYFSFRAIKPPEER